MQDQIAWRPDASMVEASNLQAFVRFAKVADYAELARRADADPAWFHDALMQHVDFRFYRPYSTVLDESQGAPWARWCVGGTTNVVLNALDRWRGTPTYERTALDWIGEQGERRSFTYRELDREVCRCAEGLRALGLGRGDVIATYLPNVPALAFEETPLPPTPDSDVAAPKTQMAKPMQLGTANAPTDPKSERKGGLNIFGYKVFPKLNFGLDVLYGQEQQQLELQQGTSTLEENGDVSVLGKVKRRF